MNKQKETKEEKIEEKIQTFWALDLAVRQYPDIINNKVFQKLLKELGVKIPKSYYKSKP